MRRAGAKVDTHAHVWTLDESRYPWHAVLSVAAIPGRPAPPERLLAEMDLAGVTRCVLVQPSTYGWDHSYLLEAVAANADRFVGVGLVNLEADAASQELRTLASHSGIRGIRFHLLDDKGTGLFLRRASELCRMAAEVEFTVAVQVRPQYLDLLDDVLQSCRDTLVVVDHMGLIPPVEALAYQPVLAALARKDNVYVKLSGAEAISSEPYPFGDCGELVQMIVDKFGPARVMWGSNSPHVLAHCSYAAISEVLEEWIPGINEDEKWEIECGTGAHFWSLDEIAGAGR